MRKSMTALFPLPLWSALLARCDAEGVSPNSVLVRALEAFLGGKGEADDGIPDPKPRLRAGIVRSPTLYR